MRNIKLSFLSFFLFASTLVSAQVDLKKIEKYIESARTKHEVPGLAVAIVKDGKVLMSKGFGTLEKGGKQNVDGNTLFAIASNTKAFVSSSIAKLVSEGKIGWDDKVVDYLPYFALYDPYVTEEVTIRDLLCHRVGLGTFSGDAIWYKSELSAEEVIKKVKNVPQAYSFRGGYGYSNLMFITAGEVIKKVTGLTWEEYVKQNFFSPLGMSRTITTISDLEAKGNYATPHKTYLGESTPIEWTRWDNMGAAGGVISSTSDMAQWMIMNLNSGVFKDKEILDKNQQNTLWTLHNNYNLSIGAKEFLPGRHFAGYGLGWGLQDYYGRMIVSHGGGYDGMYSRVAMMPDEKIGVVVLTNSMSGISTPLTYYIFNQFIGEDKQDFIETFYRAPNDFANVPEIKAARLEDTRPSKAITDYAGEFYASMYGDISVRYENEKLRLVFSHSPELSATLEHWHNDTFEIKWDKVHAWFDFGLATFELDDQLEITGMKLNVPNNDIFFHEYDIVKK